MNRHITVRRVVIVPTDRIGTGPASVALGTVLEDLVGTEVCLAMVDNHDVIYTLALDPDWTRLGLEAMGNDGDTADWANFDVPRTAVRAVIGDWPEQWDRAAGGWLQAYISDDGIPHISVSSSPSRGYRTRTCNTH